MRAPIFIALALMLCAGSATQAAAPAGSKERLRRLARLPRLSLTLGMSFDPLRGIALMPDRVLAMHEIEDLRKGMQDNASDAPRHTRIGRLLEGIGSLNEARQAYTNAVSLHRRQGAEQGDDGPTLADYGAALHGLGELDAAERVLRRGVQVAPAAWTPHAALGRLLSAQALASLVPAAANGGGDPFAALVSAEGPSAKPAPAQLEQAQTRIEESVLCYDRAIELAPDVAEVYTGRAAVRVFHNLLEWMRDPDAGSEPQPMRFARALYPPEALPDLRQAMRLAPKDPMALGTAMLFELFSSALEQGSLQSESIGTGNSWANLPERTRQSVRESLTRLEEMSQDAKSHTAAAALELLGSLQCFVVNDVPGAEQTLRRATALDSKRTQAWETLIFILATSKRSEALEAVCEDRLKAEESARARLLLAKSHEMRSDWNRVLETTETLERRYPEVVYANLAAAAAVLHTTRDEAGLRRAAQSLAKAEKLLGTAPARDEVVNLLFLRGLLFALADATEPALHQLRQVRQIEPHFEGVEEALEIVEQM